ncbi:MAG: endonuclease/exonuclease/phosphatase family protein [Planctomycetes bacterium]|nr:endonuclease/exonuclease/phosphatase family protein [Planctomycetota bacterium]
MLDHSVWRGPVWLALVLFATLVHSDQAAIGIDEDFADWAPITPVVDAIGDAGASGVDLLRLWLADDDDYLYVGLEVNTPLLLNDAHDVTLYLDTDANASTGLSVAGIGAELEWRFGDKSGVVRTGGSPTTIDQNDLGFRAAPTVTATRFECAISRTAAPDGPLFTGSTIRVVLRDDPSGDRIPGGLGGVSYDLGSGSVSPPAELATDRLSVDDVRVATLNVLNDSPWNGGGSQLGRLLAAVEADVYCFQEIYSHSAGETATWVGSWVTPPAGGWNARSNNDCKVISRFPVLGNWSLSGNLAVLIDTTARLGRNLLVVNMHLPCCTNDSGRQDEIDEILAFIRDERSGGVLDTVPAPGLVLLGDLNLVGSSQQLTSLLEGDIVDTATYGPDLAPDLDGSDLADARPRQISRRMAYSWRSDSSSFWPGRLDLFVYSDAVFEKVRDFLVYTPELSTAKRTELGVQSGDSLASDHLLMTVDLREVGTPGAVLFRRGDTNEDGAIGLGDVVRLLAIVFGEMASSCPDASDTNDDGSADVGDAVYLLAYLFAGGPAPALPMSCGIDPTPDAIPDCTAYAGCP